jgi:ribulose-5-phosphate 4-epimerase/fuculose-1-phosphate aldolase
VLSAGSGFGDGSILIFANWRKRMGEWDQERKDVLVCAQWMSEHGYFGGYRGSGGNISVRIKNRPILAVTPSGRSYGDMTADDICVVDFDLKPLEGQFAPSKEAAMHVGIYQHLFDEETKEFGPVVETIAYAISGSGDLVQNVIKKLGNNCHCYILQNHGALNLGRDIDHAWKNTELLEKVSKIYYAALITGKKIATLPKDTIDYFNKMRESM